MRALAMRALAMRALAMRALAMRALAMRAYHDSPCVGLVVVLGVLAVPSGVGAMAQARVVAQTAGVLQRNAVQVWSVEGQAGQAITVAKPELAAVAIMSPAGDEVYCASNAFGYLDPCVAWLPISGAYKVTISDPATPQRNDPRGCSRRSGRARSTSANTRRPATERREFADAQAVAALEDAHQLVEVVSCFRGGRRPCPCAAGGLPRPEAGSGKHPRA